MNSLTSLVSQISNAQKAGQASVAFVISDLSTSSKVFKFLNILVSEGFISHYSSSLSAQKGCLTVFLKYDGSGRPAIHRIFRVSNSSRRVYARSSALWQWQTNPAVFIISTVQGLITDRRARERNLGGEVLFGIRLKVNAIYWNSRKY